MEIRHAPSRRLDLNQRLSGSVPNGAIRLLIFRLTVESAPLNPKNWTPKTGKLDPGLDLKFLASCFDRFSRILASGRDEARCAAT